MLVLKVSAADESKLPVLRPPVIFTGGAWIRKGQRTFPPNATARLSVRQPVIETLPADK